MKYTIEEIEKMLVYSRPHKDLEGNILYLSSAMKEIVSDLVEEVNLIGKQLEAMSKQALSSIMDNQDLKEENKRLREALENINNSEFIFQMRKIACKALEGK